MIDGQRFGREERAAYGRRTALGSFGNPSPEYSSFLKRMAKSAFVAWALGQHALSLKPPASMSTAPGRQNNQNQLITNNINRSFHPPLSPGWGDEYNQ
jgi:hypothetical protein